MPLKWGICCTGAICNDFAATLYHLGKEKHEMVAVAGSSLDKAQTFASHFGIPKAFGNYKALADDPDIDIVYIGSLNPWHKEQSIMMLDGGKHVLCEKPLTLNSKDSKELYAHAKKKNLFLMEAIWSRFNPLYVQIRESLAKGEIGDPLTVQVEFGVPIVDFGLETRLKKELGGGAAIDIGLYCVQFAVMVFGMEKPLKIVSVAHKNEDGVDLAGTITLLYSGNRMANLSYSYLIAMQNKAVVYGTKGKLELPSIFWSPTELITPNGTIHNELPDFEKKLRLGNSQNLMHEADAVRTSIAKGETEHPYISHSESLFIMSILDEVRKQIGVSYPGE